MGFETTLATTVLRYFTPTVSPFYAVAVSGIVTLILSCEIEEDIWPFISIPIYIVLIVCLALSLKSGGISQIEDSEEQLKVSRSISISGALFCFVFAAISLADQPAPAPLYFWWSYAACLVQIGSFFVFVWVTGQKEEQQENLNFIQFSLITTAFLAGATYSITQARFPGNSEELETYKLVTQGLYILWSSCMYFWFKYLVSVIFLERARS